MPVDVLPCFEVPRVRHFGARRSGLDHVAEPIVYVIIRLRPPSQAHACTQPATIENESHELLPSTVPTSSGDIA